MTFIQNPLPELIITGGQLAALVFITDTPFRVTLRLDSLTVTVVTDEAE
ncbi:hypothetical protein [Pantoea sp. AS142]